MPFETTYAGDQLIFESGALTAFNRIHLFKNDIVPDKNIGFLDFEEADFVGYAAVVLTPFPVFTNTDGKAQIDFGSVNWVLEPTPPPIQTIYGYFITNGSFQVMGWERFTTPKIMESVGIDQIYIQFSPTCVDD